MSPPPLLPATKIKTKKEPGFRVSSLKMQSFQISYICFGSARATHVKDMLHINKWGSSSPISGVKNNSNVVFESHQLGNTKRQVPESFFRYFLPDSPKTENVFPPRCSFPLEFSRRSVRCHRGNGKCHCEPKQLIFSSVFHLGTAEIPKDFLYLWIHLRTSSPLTGKN